MHDGLIVIDKKSKKIEYHNIETIKELFGIKTDQD